jgi:ribosomal protein S25
MFVYWGTNPERFVRVWSRAGQIWHIDRDRVLTAIMCGLRITGMPGPNPSAGDLFVHAERRVALSRYEALLGACAGIVDQTIGDLMQSNAQALKDQFCQLTIGEVLSGLALAATAGVDDRPVRRSRTANRRAASQQPDTQLSMHQYARRSVAEIRKFDEDVLRVVGEHKTRGITRADLTAALGSSTSMVREAIRRLRKSGEIKLKGTKRTAHYVTKDHQEGPHDETQEDEGRA